MSVLDASVLLAFAQGETGADHAESLLEAGASCGAANWSEVAQKARSAGRDWHLVRALLASYDLTIEPVIEEDAEWAASRWQRGEGLSLADRLCLALGERLDVDVWTADTPWGRQGGSNNCAERVKELHHLLDGATHDSENLIAHQLVAI